MNILIQLNEEDVKRLVLEEIERKLGSVIFNKELVKIETKSKQNYKAEWETAAFRATYQAV